MPVSASGMTEKRMICGRGLPSVITIEFAFVAAMGMVPSYFSFRVSKNEPRFSLRRVMRKDEVFIRLRVEKSNLIRPQAERAVWLCAVFPVAAERQAAGGKLRADLMRPAGFQPDAHKRAPVLHGKHPVRKPGRPCVRAGGVRDEGLLFRRIAREKIGKNALRRVWEPLQYGKIVLFKFMRSCTCRDRMLSAMRDRA